MEIEQNSLPLISSRNLANPDFVTVPSRSFFGTTAEDLPRALIFILIGLGVWVASVLFIVIVPSLLLLPYLFLHNPPLTDSEQMVEFAKSDPTSVVLQIAGVLPAHILTIVLAWLVVSRGRKFSFFKTLGWNGGGVLTWISYPLILGAFLVVASVVSSYFPEQENDLIRMLRSSRSAVYIIAAVATFTAPFVEEVVYRGILYSTVQRVAGSPLAFIVVTFLFALVHVPQYYPSYSTIFLLVLLSLTLTAIRVKTNSLLPCVILHTLFNGLQSIGLLFEPLQKQSEISAPVAAVLHLFS